MSTTTPIKDALWVLREDAKARGMLDIVLVYGWSIMRINEDLMAANDAELRRLRAIREEGR